MNINECGCRPYGWLGLDGNRCIRVIPRQDDDRTVFPKIDHSSSAARIVLEQNKFNKEVTYNRD